jgi:N6-L-threonylcarbamoyladenine synthase
VEYINYVLGDALKAAGKKLKDIGLIAVTTRPGLVGALLVGVSLAKALSVALGIPIIAVDHLIAHLYAAFMNGTVPEFPFVGLVVSGGHTNLFLVSSVKRHKLLGQTLDDAAGEAFDKVAKLLNLGYPGGPAIQRRAALGAPDKKLFSRDSFDDSLDFSFSGVKTAVLYYLRERHGADRRLSAAGKNAAKSTRQFGATLGAREINDIAASFQDSVTDTLVKKSVEAARREKVKTLILGGGVAANAVLRSKMADACRENGIKLRLPPVELCLDNGAMVAGLGGALYKSGTRSSLYIGAQSSGSYPR